jgi:hypothetical protein
MSGARAHHSCLHLQTRSFAAFTCSCSHLHATPSHRANTNGSSLAPRFHFTAYIKAPLAHCSPSSSQSFLRTTDLPRPIFLNDHLNSPTIPTHRPYQLTDHTNSPTDPHQRPFLTDRTTDLPRTRPRTRVRRHPRSLSPLSSTLGDCRGGLPSVCFTRRCRVASISALDRSPCIVTQGVKISRRLAPCFLNPSDA